MASNDFACGNGSSPLPLLEPLDPRRLLAGVSVVDKTIVIDGTEGPDRIEVIVDFRKKVLNVYGLPGSSESKPKRVALQHRRVLVNGLGGDDELLVNARHGRKGVNPKFRALVRGGDGDDHLIGDYVFTKIFGEAGDDFLGGNYGKTRQFGGAGNDVLNAGWSDRSFLDGGEGADEIRLFPTFNNPRNDSDTIVGDAADTWLQRYVGDALADYEGTEPTTVLKAAGVEPDEELTVIRGTATR